MVAQQAEEAGGVPRPVDVRCANKYGWQRR
jgi:hypothetical protein